METVSGRLRFSKTSCYLCSEWLDDAEVEIHLRKCRVQRTVCPNRCGTIVTRKELQLHRNTCRQSYGESMEPSNVQNNVPACPAAEMTIDEVIASLEQDMNAIQLLQSEQAELRTGMHAELAHLKRFFDVSKCWTAKVYESIVKLHKVCYKEKVEHSLEISALLEKLKASDQWHAHIAERVEVLEKKVFFIAQNCDIAEEEEEEADDGIGTDPAKDESESKLRAGTVAEPQPSAAKPLPDPTSPLNQPLAAQLPKLEDSDSDATPPEAVYVPAEAPTMNELVQGLRRSQAKMHYEVKDAAVRLFECEEQISDLETVVGKYRREAYYTKQRMEELQSNLLAGANRSLLASENGHVIWRIDDVAKRFHQSKEQETMMKGPIFTNQPFGYILQVEANLYGIGTWRGRNLIAGLTILPGPYDPLLEWPCRLTATLCLRDQPDIPSEALDVCKPIVAKVKGLEDRKHHYVFIPHDVMKAKHYVKNDTMFLEVTITKE